jgi:hypothetical protein
VLGNLEIDDAARHGMEFSVLRHEYDDLPIDAVTLDVQLRAIFEDEDSGWRAAAIVFF